MKTEQTLQESLIGRFLMYRFFVTEDEQFNATIWQACTREVHCNPEKETNLNGDEPCALFCLSGDATHKNFVENIMPIYQQQVRMGETWALDVNSVEMLPIDTVSANGGTWQIRATINSNLFGPIQILAYAQIARNLNLYPQTLGYYIKSFNAYKIS
ncbi:MAG: hypothetical protein IKZ34_01315 [Alphaproteobacteria bacterium]|nr:hypothetical protein [Alphaproteobacteria bacterium]